MKLLFNHASDNRILAATITVPVGTVLAGFGTANLGNMNPALGLQLSDLRLRLVFDFGSAVECPFPVIDHHNITAAANWEANATDAWGAPTFSQAFTVGAVDGMGYYPNLYRDMRLLPNFGPFRYWSLDLDNADNANPIRIGEIWIGGTVREVLHNYSWDFRRDDVTPGQSGFKTRYGVEWVYPSIGRQRGLRGDIETTDPGLAILHAWHKSAAKDAPVVIVPNTPNEPDAWIVRWTTDFGYDGKPVQGGTQEVGWLELARGPAW